MSAKSQSRLLLFYPTSPVHVRDVGLLTEKLPDWRCKAILYNPLARVAPEIDSACRQHGLEHVELVGNVDLDKELPGDASALLLGAVFEHFALELFVWAKERSVPVIAIEEVAQLALNQLDICNYDAPFDRLFIASPEEYRLFLKLGHPAETLRVSGLLANDRFENKDLNRNEEILNRLGITDGKHPIVYTTSPLKGRLSLHNKDNRGFRQSVLAAIAEASHNTGRLSVIKLHPNENPETEREFVHEIIPNAVVIGSEMGMDELLPITGVLVNRGNSQTSLEAVLRGVPTVVAACGLKTLFHDDGGAYVVEEIADLANTLEIALAQGAPDALRVKAKHFFLPPNGVANFIAAEISALADGMEPANENSWNWLIKSLLFLGQQNRALLLCDHLNPPSPWQQHVRTALRAHVEDRPQDVTKAWLECTVDDREWFFPHYELAHGYLGSAQYDKAIRHALKAIALHPPFHSLWHELPMRVVIMASYRMQGQFKKARAELGALEKRGVAEMLPELLIERAAQYCYLEDDLAEAERCLEVALRQLESYPVHPFGDAHITERAISQYLDVADGYANQHARTQSLVCLKRGLELSTANDALRERISWKVSKLGEKREKIGDYRLAESCYSLALEGTRVGHWPRYQMSRLALRQGNPIWALRDLYSLAALPEAPRQIIDHAFPSSVAKLLSSYWPTSQRSVVRPLILCLYTSVWFLKRILTPWSNNILDTLTAVVFVWLFVARHFTRRCPKELLSIRKMFGALHVSFSRRASYHYERVVSCPICLGSGKLEYENKVTPLFRCQNCDHVYARNLPDDTTLTALYGDFSYREKDRHHQGITSIRKSKEWQTYLDARIGILQRLKLLEQSTIQPKSVFEIGCAEGMLLHELRTQGMLVQGCEVNRAVAEAGMKQLGVDILTQPFESLDLPVRSYDLIVAFHTLEHLKYPAKVLEKSAEILRPEGSILIEVPCGEEEYDNTDHLHFFSERSLKLLLDQFFVWTDIVLNTYTNSAGVQIGSLYGVGRGVRNRTS
jgi:SAM-dependent methyltransferase/tetratricopeptide (TPR) repeat protein